MKQSGAQVGEESQLAAQSQKRLFGAVVAAQMIPFRTAHRTEQHGVGIFAGVNGVLRQGTAVSIYGDAARRLFRKIENVPVFFADGVQNVYRLADNVRPYPVAGDGYDIEIHSDLLISCFSR